MCISLYRHKNIRGGLIKENHKEIVSEDFDQIIKTLNQSNIRRVLKPYTPNAISMNLAWKYPERKEPIE